MNDYYVQDVEFGSAHNPLQAPVFLSWVAASQGFVPPDPSRPFTYCDLGCGNGVTLNGLAAVHPDSHFVGVDFNERHIESARELAGAAGITNADFQVASFESLGSLGLPKFDYIGMNGIYSWLHPRVVESVIDFLGSHLTPNGLFVVEYLTLPGAAAVAPMWKLMREITSHVDGGPTERAAAGLDALAKLRQHNARYFTDNPRQSGHIERLHERRDDEQLLAWLAHSSLADNWHPKYFAEVSQELGDAGLAFAGSVHLALNDVELSIPTSLRGMFDSLRSERQIEGLKDFILNRSQRTDVFTNETERDPAAADQFRQERLSVSACVEKEAARTAVKSSGRSLQGAEKERCLDVVERLCDAEQAVAVGDLGADGRTLTRLLLTGLFHVHAGSPRVRGPGHGSAEGLCVPLEINRIHLEKAAAALEPTALVLEGGGCVRLSGLESLVLWTHLETPEEDDRRQLLQAAIERHEGPIQIGDQVTTSAWISEGQIEEAMHHFEEQRLPMLARLGIVTPGKPEPH